MHVPGDASRAHGPDFARAQLPPALALPAHDWPAEQWWREYHDPQLDALVATALRDNPTLAVAQARMAGAGAQVAAERAAGGAELGVASGFNRQRYSSNGFFPPPIGGAFYNDASVQLRAAYDFDWWGRHRSLIAAALGEADARRAEAAQAQQVLAASVVQSYLRLQLLWARQDNTRALVALQRDLAAGRRARMAQGLATSDDLRSAELELAQLEEQAQRFDTEAGRERENLRALSGGDPAALGALARVRPALPPDALPRTLGLELLARRPDLQAARWRVEAQLGRVAAAEAAFRPDINLAGALGLDAISLGKLLRYPSRTLLLGATLDLPLFDGGRLDAQLGVARSERDTLLAEYNGAVLDAVAEVAREAATLQGIAHEAAAHGAAARAGDALAASAEARLARGLANRATVLQARKEVLRQRDVELQLLDAQLQTRVALVKALGGGYRAAPERTAALPPSPTTHSNPNQP